MAEGVIIRSLSGFYDISGQPSVRCRARGKFRREGLSPLVGDRVRYQVGPDGSGTVTEILPRRNWFIRPAVANVDLLVILASAVNPVTDPYLLDRVMAIARHAGCEAAVCLNKCDLDPADRLFDIYSTVGCPLLRTSAVTGEGVEALRQLMAGKTCAFTGNSGVGKSSLLNCLAPSLALPVGEVSEKLGRGRHTTRHVELYALDGDTYIADTPGFASFDVERVEPIRKEELPGAFREFDPYQTRCRFRDCTHRREPDCAVRSAVEAGAIHPSRYESYLRMYALAEQVKDWEREDS